MIAPILNSEMLLEDFALAGSFAIGGPCLPEAGQRAPVIAECQFKLGLEDDALSTLNNILSTLESRWQAYEPSCQLPRYNNIGGEQLFSAIMNEKYKAMFLNMQTISDWRRTGYPLFIDNNNNSTECVTGIPRRLPYPDLEKKSNSNVPPGDSIYDRVENDPN